MLLLGSRGINHKTRHLIEDLNKLLAHTKSEAKFHKQNSFKEINEIAELKNCQNVMFFEARKKQDTFLWLSPSPEEGPSIRFLVENIHTLAELRFTGNCLAKSRPVLSFHADFDSKPEWKIVRSALEKVFNVPRYHPKKYFSKIESSQFLQFQFLKNFPYITTVYRPYFQLFHTRWKNLVPQLSNCSRHRHRSCRNRAKVHSDATGYFRGKPDRRENLEK